MSDIEKDAFIWGKIILAIEIISLIGMIITGFIYPHDELFRRFTIVTISIAISFISVIVFLVIQVFSLSSSKDNSEISEDSPSQKA